MAAPIVVQSVPFMPERAWTTCVSGGCVSGLARSNYVPFAPQPTPPGMTEAEYEALPDAPVPGFGVPPPLDCFPRYVMWREERTPDFAGGEPRIQWNRNPGWDYRNDCVAEIVATTVSGHVSFVGDGQPACPGTTVHLVNETTPADLTTVCDVNGDFLFTDPPGFAQDDFWRVRIESGDPVAPCTAGADLPVQSPQLSWNVGTAMSYDLDIPGI